MYTVSLGLTLHVDLPAWIEAWLSQAGPSIFLALAALAGLILIACWMLFASQSRSVQASGLGLIGGLLVLFIGNFVATAKAPPPPQPAPPKVEPKPKPKLPWREPTAVAGASKITIGGPVAPDGKTAVATDLPQDLLKKNISSRGLGCCVFRSVSYLGLWQQIPALYDLPEYMVSKGIAGGGYPSKLASVVERAAKDRNLPAPMLVQYEGGSNADPAVIKAALKTGRPVGVTYDGRCPFYGSNSHIAHMVVCVYLDDQLAAICDNNHPKDYVWMSASDFLSRWRGNGGGWAVVAIERPGPPPVPKN